MKSYLFYYELNDVRQYILVHANNFAEANRKATEYLDAFKETNGLKITCVTLE